MAGWSDIKRWKASNLDGFIDAIISRKREAASVADDTVAITIETWEGEGAEAAQSTLTSLIERGEKLQDNIQYLLTAASTAQDGIGDVETLVLEAQSRADHYGFVIAEDGSQVTDPELDSWWERFTSNMAAGQSHAYAAELAERKGALEDTAEAVSNALSRATEVDQAFCDALGRISDDQVTAGMAAGSGLIPGLPESPSTEEAAIWWDSLSKDEQDYYIETYPELIGGMDGVDGWARHEANEARLTEDLEEALEAQAGGDDSPELQAQIDEMEALLGSLKPADGEVRQLLLYEPSTGEDGNYHMQAAVAVGDVDEADHITTFVPGMTTTVHDSVGNYTADLHNLNRVAQGKLDAMGGGETVASIAWLGYDAPGSPTDMVLVDSMEDVMPGDVPLIIPQGTPEYPQPPLIYSVDPAIVSPARAEQGGENLTSFIEGIHDSRTHDTTNPAVTRDPHTSVLGHSYGSTTSSYGVADARPGTVDDYAAFGTPGVDGGSWNMNSGNNYVMNFENEELIRYLNNPLRWISGIPDAGGLGVDPSQDPGFTTLDPGQADPGTAHTQYLDDNSKSQSELADVVIGVAGNDD